MYFYLNLHNVNFPCWDDIVIFAPFQLKRHAISSIWLHNIITYLNSKAYIFNRGGPSNKKKIVAAFWGMHVSPVKYSYAWQPRKSDYRKDRHTDSAQSDPYVPLCCAGDTKMPPHYSTSEAIVPTSSFAFLGTDDYGPWEISEECTVNLKQNWYKICMLTKCK